MLFCLLKVKKNWCLHSGTFYNFTWNLYSYFFCVLLNDLNFDISSWKLSFLLWKLLKFIFISVRTSDSSRHFMPQHYMWSQAKTCHYHVCKGGGAPQTCDTSSICWNEKCQLPRPGNHMLYCICPEQKCIYSKGTCSICQEQDCPLPGSVIYYKLSGTPMSFTSMLHVVSARSRSAPTQELLAVSARSRIAPYLKATFTTTCQEHRCHLPRCYM
jgi:hypothetical protein